MLPDASGWFFNRNYYPITRSLSAGAKHTGYFLQFECYLLSFTVPDTGTQFSSVIVPIDKAILDILCATHKVLSLFVFGQQGRKIYKVYPGYPLHPAQSCMNFLSCSIQNATLHPVQAHSTLTPTHIIRIQDTPEFTSPLRKHDSCATG